MIIPLKNFPFKIVNYDRLSSIKIVFIYTYPCTNGSFISCLSDTWFI